MCSCFASRALDQSARPPRPPCDRPRPRTAFRNYSRPPTARRFRRRQRTAATLRGAWAPRRDRGPRLNPQDRFPRSQAPRPSPETTRPGKTPAGAALSARAAPRPAGRGAPGPQVRPWVRSPPRAGRRASRPPHEVGRDRCEFFLLPAAGGRPRAARARCPGAGATAGSGEGTIWGGASAAPTGADWLQPRRGDQSGGTNTTRQNPVEFF